MTEAKFQKELELNRLKEESDRVRWFRDGAFLPWMELAAGPRAKVLGHGPRAWAAKTAESVDSGA